MDYLAKAQRVIQIEIDELQRLLRGVDDSFSAAVETLQQSLDERGKIVVVGIGKCDNIAHKLAATLNSTGATAVVLNSSRLAAPSFSFQLCRSILMPTPNFSSNVPRISWFR